MTNHYDIAVVGAGILGLAHAWHLAKAGKRVVVFERHARAQGASVRNFGMVWPIGQPAGEHYALALRSREIWLDVLSAAGLWHDRRGSLHLAYEDDEAQVLREFVADGGHRDRSYELLGADQVAQIAPWVKTPGLRLGLFSPVETCVDPRQVVADLPAFLRDTLGVRFEFDTSVLGYDRPTVRTSRGDFRADQLVVCGGDEFQVLYPELFAGSGLIKCKLQMMRAVAQPAGQRMGPMLAAGLTQLHYKSFAACPTLPAVRRRMEATMSDYIRYGIHVLVSQPGTGEITLGDTHEYGDDISIFNKERLDEMVLSYLDRFFAAPRMTINERWFGIYAKHPSKPWLHARPADGATVVTGVGGAGMTLSFGLAEKVSAEVLQS